MFNTTPGNTTHGTSQGTRAQGSGEAKEWAFQRDVEAVLYPHFPEDSLIFTGRYLRLIKPHGRAAAELTHLQERQRITLQSQRSQRIQQPP